MIQQAIETDDPVLFYEPKRRYWDKGEVDESAAPRGSSRPGMPRGHRRDAARLRAHGQDLPAGRRGRRGGGQELEVIDLRSLSPLDMDALLASVQKTGRMVVVHEASTFLGLGAEIAAAVTQRCFYHLEAPVLRVGGYNLPYPPSRLEEEFLPDLDRVLDAVDRSLAY